MHETPEEGLDHVAVTRHPVAPVAHNCYASDRAGTECAAHPRRSKHSLLHHHHHCRRAILRGLAILTFLHPGFSSFY